MATKKTPKPKKEYKPYYEKLRDPRWQRKRLEIMQRDKFQCRECKSESSTLNVHHFWYDKGAEPWEYDNGVLITLCEGCHKELHVRQDKFKKMFGISAYSQRLNILLLGSLMVPEEAGIPPRIHWLVSSVAELLRSIVDLSAAISKSDGEKMAELDSSIKDHAYDVIENATMGVRQVLDGWRYDR
jgi:hypothetical protein